MNNTTPQKTRGWIEVVSRFSNWDEKGVLKALQERTYAQRNSWQFFIKCFFIGLGSAFIISGVIFFFAFNWNNLNKLVKLAMAEGALVIVFLIMISMKLHEIWKEALIVSCALLVGVCFAVFGQIYQTGANAYDFFMGWSVFITIWVICTSYPVLWLLYLSCVNTAIVLYSEQVSRDWSTTLTSGLCFAVTLLILLYAEYRSAVAKDNVFPTWFYKVLGLACAVFLTTALVSGIFFHYSTEWIIIAVLSLPICGTAVFMGIKRQDLFYVALIPFFLIVILSSFIVRYLFNEAAFFIIGFFVIGSIAALVLLLIRLKRSWNGK